MAIDLDNVFYGNFDSTTKLKDAAEELEELALEVINEANGDWSEVERAVTAVTEGCPSIAEDATRYYSFNSKSSLAFEYLLACKDTVDACAKCLEQVEKALPDGPGHDEAAIKLRKAAVEVAWREYTRAKNIGKLEKSLVESKAASANRAIDRVKELYPSYTHMAAGETSSGSSSSYGSSSSSSSRYTPSPIPEKKGGCYVATAVYGSYDCPQVWVLRRYRDETLAQSWYGRAFIRLYYAVSPTLVKWFGERSWFKKLWKGKLDRMVQELRSNGVEDTPYQDRSW